MKYFLTTQLKTGKQHWQDETQWEETRDILNHVWRGIWWSLIVIKQLHARRLHQVSAWIRPNAWRMSCNRDDHLLLKPLLWMERLCRQWIERWILWRPWKTRLSDQREDVGMQEWTTFNYTNMDDNLLFRERRSRWKPRMGRLPSLPIVFQI